MSAPNILRLKIERFRGISNLDWRPAAGLKISRAAQGAPRPVREAPCP
jgi:hypothetical protein